MQDRNRGFMWQLCVDVVLRAVSSPHPCRSVAQPLQGLFDVWFHWTSGATAEWACEQGLGVRAGR